MKPWIYNREYTYFFERDDKKYHRGIRVHKPWVVSYGEQEYAIAATLEAALDELVRLQWASEIPEPGSYS